MKTELRQSDNYALFILQKIRRRKGFATTVSIHEQMVKFRMVARGNQAATSAAVLKLFKRGALRRIICHSSDGRYAYASK
jgi:hypothetical protein